MLAIQISLEYRAPQFWSCYTHSGIWAPHGRTRELLVKKRLEKLLRRGDGESFCSPLAPAGNFAVVTVYHNTKLQVRQKTFFLSGFLRKSSFLRLKWSPSTKRLITLKVEALMNCVALQERLLWIGRCMVRGAKLAYNNGVLGLRRVWGLNTEKATFNLIILNFKVSPEDQVFPQNYSTLIVWHNSLIWRLLQLWKTVFLMVTLRCGEGLDRGGRRGELHSWNRSDCRHWYSCFCSSEA